MQVGEDPGAIRERFRGLAAFAAPAAEGVVDGLELAGDVIERLLLGSRAGCGAFLLAQLVVLGETSGRSSGELRLALDAARPGDRAACGGCLERYASQAFNTRHEDRGLVQQCGA